MNNSEKNCAILLKFRTYFDHVTFDVPQTFKAIGLQVKVTTSLGQILKSQ